MYSLLEIPFIPWAMSKSLNNTFLRRGWIQIKVYFALLFIPSLTFGFQRQNTENFKLAFGKELIYIVRKQNFRC